jgi:type I restriction enzyme S subunit
MTQTVLLGDICSRITDGAHWSPESTENGFPMASVKDMQDYGLNLKTCRKISKEDYQKLVKDGCRPEKDDVLIAKDGSYLKHLFVSDGLADVVLLSSIAILKPNLDLVDPRYLVYYIRNQRDNYDLSQYVSGAAIPRIILKNFARMPIKLPDMKTQKEIVDVLGSIDEKTELNRKMNETLEQMGQALFRHYFITNPEAKNWEVGKVGDVLSALESGSRAKGGAVASGVPSIGAENIDGLGKYDFSKERFVSEEFFDNAKRGKIKSEDVLLYKDGAYVGKKSLFMDGFPHKKCMVNEHVFILRTNKRLKSHFYLYFWLDQTHITDKIVSNGVKAAQPGLNQSGVKTLPILIPEAKTIEEFDNKVRPVMEKIYANSKQIQTLATLRDTLLPRLISGSIKLD